jgi:multidrug transporter EmrE-like cation transporter
VANFIPLIFFTVVTNFLSQIMLKKGMTSVEHFDLSLSSVLTSSLTILFNPYVFFGLIMMVISMGSHLVVLSRVEISFAYPFLGLSFVLITLYGHFVLDEGVTAWRVLGVLLICSGVALVARSG